MILATDFTFCASARAPTRLSTAATSLGSHATPASAAARMPELGSNQWQSRGGTGGKIKTAAITSAPLHSLATFEPLATINSSSITDMIHLPTQSLEKTMVTE